MDPDSLHTYLNEEDIPIPPCLGCRQILNAVFCCCPSKHHVAYTRTLELVKKDVHRSMDILAVLLQWMVNGGVSTSPMELGEVVSPCLPQGPSGDARCPM